MTTEIKAHSKNKTYGCDDCRFYANKHCKLWQVKVEDAHNQHCESHQWRG